MRNILLLIFMSAVLFSSCSTTAVAPVTKAVAYKGMYDEKPLSVLLMPPINNSTNVEAKEYFHATLNMPLSDAGFYVLPTFLSMEILKKESAYDAELFLESPLDLFGEVFGADLAVFTIIHKWDKSSIAANVNVKVEYIIKSIKTNEVLYNRVGEVVYDTSITSGTGGLAGLLGDFVASAINTAATKYIDVARACNAYTLSDLPLGKYNPAYGTDGDDSAGQQNFSTVLNSKY